MSNHSSLLETKIEGTRMNQIKKAHVNTKLSSANIVYESDTRQIKEPKKQMIVKTSILLKRTDYAKIKKLCEICNISFSEYVEESLASMLEGNLGDPEGIGERALAHVTRMKNI
jgi:hypothetical protein